jgi:hypothetical protein
MELRRAVLQSRLSPKTLFSSKHQIRLRRGISAAHEPQFQRNFASSPNYSAPRDVTASSTEQSINDDNLSIPSTSGLSEDWLHGTLNQNRAISPPQPAKDKNNSTPHSGQKKRTASLFSDPKRQSENFANQGNSASDLFAALIRPGNSPKSKEFDFTRMVQPPSASPTKLMEVLRSKELKIPTATRQLMRLTPQIGRTVTLGAGVDLFRGIRLLEQSCRRNSVKADFNKQRFHERPGLKRKRLKSQRWRKNFMIAFKSTVNRVKRLRAQGW